MGEGNAAASVYDVIARQKDFSNSALYARELSCMLKAHAMFVVLLWRNRIVVNSLVLE